MALIDKEAALAEMDYYISAKKLVEDILEARGIEIETVPKLIRLIKAQPRQEPKRGRWKREVLGSTSGYGTTIMYRCSLCERMSISEYNYCPNCGAKKEGQDETD